MNSSESGLPFNDIRELLLALPEAHEEIGALTASQLNERVSADTGKVGELCTWYALWSGRSPVIGRAVVTLFAGTHAVDTSTDEWLLQQVTSISQGAAPINQLCHESNLGLKVLDLALQIPVANITQEAALDEKACAGTIAFGMEAIAGGVDLLCVGATEHGLNASTLALLSILSAEETETLAEQCGLNANDRLVFLAKSAVDRAIRFKDDPLELLRHLGGRETAALCGAILAARSQHIPVLVAGFSGLAALLVLSAAEEGAIAHCKLAQATGVSSLDNLNARIGLSTVLPNGFVPEPVLQLALSAQMLKSATVVWRQPA